METRLEADSGKRNGGHRGGNICRLKRTTQDPSFARCNYLEKLGKSDLEFLLFLLFTHESIIMSIEECLPEK